jgi:hypothetical protein
MFGFAFLGCGRSELGDFGEAPALPEANRSGDGSTHAPDEDASFSYDASVPPPIVVGADAAEPVTCAVLPPLAPGCPLAPPLPRSACNPPADPQAACYYATGDGQGGTAIVSFTCGVAGEDLLAWRKDTMPCAEQCLAGGAPLDVTSCMSREMVPCSPSPGQSPQDLLDFQIFAGACVHHEGAGGFTVRFDARGCPATIAGGAFDACDVAYLEGKRFACALEHSCATAPTLVK